MSDYRINKVDLPEDTDEDHKLKPMRATSKTHAAKQEELSEIIRQINMIWGSDVPAVEGAEVINAIADKVTADDISRVQIRNSSNSKEAIIQDGRLERIVKLAAIQLKSDEFVEMVDKALNDRQSFSALLPLIYDLVNNRERLDIEEIKKADKE